MRYPVRDDDHAASGPRRGSSSHASSGRTQDHRSRVSHDPWATEYSASYYSHNRGGDRSAAPAAPGQTRSRRENDALNMRRAANSHTTHTVAPASSAAGYNSEDERRDGDDDAGPAVMNEFADDHSFVQGLKNRRGWLCEPMEKDGACMFRAVAFHLYGDQDMHGTVRDHCMDYMARNKEHFQDFVTEEFESYIARKRRDRTYGNHLELQAISELYGRNVEVYAYGVEPINTFTSQGGNTDAPIRVSYHGNIHYNAIHDPNRPSFGVGLGFAGLKPGEADRSQVEKAKALSEQALVDQQLLQQSLQQSIQQHQQSEDELLMQAIEASVLAESRKEYWNSHGSS